MPNFGHFGHGMRAVIRRLRRRRDEGFTLVELIVVVAVIGIIAVPLTGVLIDYFLNSSRISARLNESHDEQIAAAYWQQDVASIGVRSKDFDATTKTFPFQRSVDVSFGCTPPAGSTQVVLAWDQYDASGNPTLNTVAYLTDGTKLIRAACSGGSLVSVTTMAHMLSATPTITCWSAGGAPLDCNDSYWDTNVPVSVDMKLSVSDPSGNGQPYTVTLSGQRRQT